MATEIFAAGRDRERDFGMYLVGSLCAENPIYDTISAPNRSSFQMEAPYTQRRVDS